MFISLVNSSENKCLYEIIEPKNLNFINILSMFMPNFFIEKFVHVATWKRNY